MTTKPEAKTPTKDEAEKAAAPKPVAKHPSVEDRLAKIEEALALGDPHAAAQMMAAK